MLPGAHKAGLHIPAGTPERFQELMVDVFRLRVTDLFIVDAVIGMEDDGPASPDLREIGLILASDNAVAVDSVISRMMGCDPGRLRFLQRVGDSPWVTATWTASKSSANCASCLISNFLPPGARPS